MAQVKWIKLSVDMFDDEKIKLIQNMPDGDSLLVVWIKLLTLAGKTNDGGYIYINESMPYTEEMLATIMNKPLTTIKFALEAFSQFKMIEIDTNGIYLVNFEKYQSLDRMQELREYNRLAQQKHRAKIKEEKMSLTSQCCQDIDIDKDKDIDNNIKENNKKKKYGEYKHVLLTDNELQSLKSDYDNCDDLIKYLDEYIEMKGYKAKNHYLAIKKWVVDAVKQHKSTEPYWLNQKIERVEPTEEELEELKEIQKKFEETFNLNERG